MFTAFAFDIMQEPRGCLKNKNKNNTLTSHHTYAVVYSWLYSSLNMHEVAQDDGANVAKNRTFLLPAIS
jgi:hypothetical protein